MTNVLKKAFDEAARLDGVEQDALGRWLLEELASQRRWDETLSGSQDALSGLADEALGEYRQGQSRSLDPDEL